MTGYWGLPEANLIDADGWLHSGDLGRIDEEGFLHVTGRSKDIIIRGGENVAASVIEDRLVEHEDVAEAAVIGLPHHDLGEEVGAVVVPRPGARIDPEELARFVRDALSYFQVPSRWWVHEQPLPTNAVGKVLKPLLRDNWPAGC
jgi:long-chain acyl-CoA synthetase